MPNTFPKNSKLCGKERIAALYKEGQRFTAWPLRVCYQETEENTQVLVWAPKSLFKRMEPVIVHINDQEHFLIAFNYMDKEEQPYAVIEKAICKALLKVKGER